MFDWNLNVDGEVEIVEARILHEWSIDKGRGAEGQETRVNQTQRISGEGYATGSAHPAMRSQRAEADAAIGTYFSHVETGLPAQPGTEKYRPGQDDGTSEPILLHD